MNRLSDELTMTWINEYVNADLKIDELMHL